MFVGIAGNHHETVERQLTPVLEKAGVTELVIPTPDLGQIARHTDASKDIVKRLHVDGVIGGALITAGGQKTFRIVIYDGQGNMRSLDETPLAGKKLTGGDLEVLAINLGDEVGDLGKGKKTPNGPRAEALADIQIDAPKKAPSPVPAPPARKAAVHDDDEAPPGLPASRPARSAPPKAELATPTFGSDSGETSHEAAPKETADASAVSMDEIEAMTGGGGDATIDGGSSTATAAAPESTLHLHVGAGLALIGRVFTPPMALNGFTSTPVGGAQFAAGVSPTERTSLDVMAEQTLAMTTSLATGTAATKISRWEIRGSYALAGHANGTQVVANLGLGHRAFSMESIDPSRTPNNEYNYVMLGARLAQPLGDKLTLRGEVQLEPVFGGADGMQMTLGPSTRWGLDLGAALEYRLAAHFVARGAFDYQRFSWSWDAAGARGASGASDSYPSGSLALRTEF
ncbi:MAG TPA: hypothetical protein VIV58_27300 [Kofleriaceae bacterium]